MSTLDNLARRWADRRLIAEADRLRRDLIKARAAVGRAAQVQRRAALELAAMTEALAGCRRQRDLAERERDAALAEARLTPTLVARVRAWRDAWRLNEMDGPSVDLDRALIAAVDALPVQQDATVELPEIGLLEPDRPSSVAARRRNLAKDIPFGMASYADRDTEPGAVVWFPHWPAPTRIEVPSGGDAV